MFCTDMYTYGEEENLATLDPEDDWEVFAPWLEIEDVICLWS